MLYRQILFSITYAAIVVCVAVYSWTHPIWNWDLIGYAASVAAIDLKTPEAIHERTYTSLKAAIPDRFDEFTRDDGYRRAILSNPSYLVQQIPFYAIRPGYVLSLYGLQRLGLTVPRASVLISIVAYLLICALVWRWTQLKLNGGALGFAMATLLAIGPPLSIVAGLTTPDALSGLFTLTAIYLLFERNRILPALGVLGASVFVRSDNLFLCILVSGFLFIHRLKNRRPVTLPIVFTGGCLLAVVLIHRAVHNLGWKTVVYHTFVSLLPNPGEIAPPLSATGFLRLYISGLASVRYSYVVICALFVLSAAMAMRSMGRGLRLNGTAQAMVVVLLSVAVHFMIFPVFWDRYFVGQYLALLILCAGVWAEASIRLAHHGQGSAQQGEPEIAWRTSGWRSTG